MTYKQYTQQIPVRNSGLKAKQHIILNPSRTPVACLVVIHSLKPSVKGGALGWGASSVYSARCVKKCHCEQEGVMQTFKVLLKLVIKVVLSCKISDV